jgi:FtsP/CotA-like multicopper oxidase with cupredoxin domain
LPFTRRRFLQTAGAALGAAGLPASPSLAALRRTDLSPAVFRQRIRASGPETEVWGFNGSTPGPVLRYRQGDAVDIRVVNGLPQPTAVHWHGVRVPNAMDGVPNVTQAAIETGGSFDYRYRVRDSGTYWYHPHQSSFEQVGRGLYGMLIVEEPRPLPVDREVQWVLSDIKLGEDNRQAEDFGRIADFGSDGRHGNVILLNGGPAGPDRALALRPNERVRLRLLNASAARAFVLEFAGHAPWVVSYDGQGVAPQPLANGRLRLAAGQRTDLVIDGAGSAGQSFAVMDRRGNTQLASIAYAGRPVRAKVLGAPAAIAPNRLPEPDVSKATDHYLVFEGGLNGAPAIGAVDGKALKVEEIMEKHGLAWTMNYSAQHEHAMMHDPLFHLRKGEHVVLKMINHSDYEHPMHLHGHFFRVLALNDAPNRQREWRDTVVVGPRGSCDVAFVADNEGEWMLHCHILDHAAGGMMGTVVVES